jgi:tRNA(fMet)-specific endonuclease VapC
VTGSFASSLNAVSARHQHSLGADPLAEGTGDGADPARFYTSVIVEAELRYGAARKGSERLSRQVEAVLGSIPIEPWREPFGRIYAELRLGLERAGTPIGANDLLIGAQALADGSVLVTDNTREFERLTDLTIENWVRP